MHTHKQDSFHTTSPCFLNISIIKIEEVYFYIFLIELKYFTPFFFDKAFPLKIHKQRKIKMQIQHQ